MHPSVQSVHGITWPRRQCQLRRTPAAAGAAAAAGAGSICSSGPGADLGCHAGRGVALRRARAHARQDGRQAEQAEGHVEAPVGLRRRECGTGAGIVCKGGRPHSKASPAQASAGSWEAGVQPASARPRHSQPGPAPASPGEPAAGRPGRGRRSRRRQTAARRGCRAAAGAAGAQGRGCPARARMRRLGCQGGTRSRCRTLGRPHNPGRPTPPHQSVLAADAPPRTSGMW